MQLTAPAPLLRTSGGVQEHSLLERSFPVPDFITMPGTGIDISDNSIKWLSFRSVAHGLEVQKCGEIALPNGIVEAGVIIKPEELAGVLKSIKVKHGIHAVHAALPEEAAYVFAMVVPDMKDREQVMHMIEFELEGRVPLRANQALYDFDVVSRSRDGEAQLSVTVFPDTLVEGYVRSFALSGLELLSLEIEARSIARSVIPPMSEELVLLADFGRARTGIAIVKRQIPIFTTTVGVGGDALTEVIKKELKVTQSEAEKYKNEFGLDREQNAQVQNVVIGNASALADEIMRHYHYWDARRNEHGERVTPVARIVLGGGGANLKGLSDYIASRVQAPTMIADVWQNVCSYDAYIPPITSRRSLGFATAIGLALRSM